MALGWKELFDLAWAAITAFVKRRVFRKADADAGAKKQKADQDATDDKAKVAARAHHDEWKHLSPEERRRRLDRDGTDGV